MNLMNESDIAATGAVDNQSPIFGGHNAYDTDPLLKHLSSQFAQPVRDGLSTHGRWAGHGETIELARLANRNTPVLKTHDIKGNRLDQVEFHPAYHALMRRSASVGLHNSIWTDNGNEHGVRNAARAIRFYMTAGVEMGHLCPITMTNAAAAALITTPTVADEWLSGIRTNDYDSSHRPPAAKKGLTVGMGMTEKQGGTDVRANITRAEPAGDGQWAITGHKWFMSAPMCDGFLVLAQADQGLTCFMMPRILPDGRPNSLHFQRLKDKLGNRSNASSEVEFAGALAMPVGEPGRGVATILEMVTLTRLDCVVSSAGLMRTCLAEAVEHCRHRRAFGELLIDQPLMARVLADLALEVIAATALAMRLARSYDAAANDPNEAAYARLMTPAVKFWVCKITPAVIYEILECLGGNGYVEDGNLARHYREAPLNAIWEGSGNVMCLDVLRAAASGNEILGSVMAGLERDLGEGSAKTVEVIRSAAAMAGADQGSARILTEQLALTAAAAELRRLNLGEVADAFMETRLGGLWRNTYGMLDNRYGARAILDAYYPPLN